MDNLIKAIEELEKKNKLKILKYLNEETNVKIFEHRDGSRINLDKMNDEQMDKFKEFVDIVIKENPLEDKYKTD